MTTPAPVASNPVLRMTLIVGGIVNAVIAVIAGIVGFLLAAQDGMWSAIVGVLFGFVFLAITALTILIANRWNGTELYATLFFAIVLGGWLVKFVIFLVGFFLIKDQPWLDSQIFYVALVVTELASLVVDVVVMQKMRIPIEIALPETLADAGEENDLENGAVQRSDREEIGRENQGSEDSK